jgi:hypothetical protein
MSLDLDAVKLTLARLDEQLRPIAQAIPDFKDPAWLDKFRSGPRPLDQAGVRPEAEAVLGSLLEAYRTEGPGVRGTIRSLLALNPSFTWATGVPQTPTTEEGFRLHLLHISAMDHAQDLRDTIFTLNDICAKAKAAGVDIVFILNEVAALSSDNRQGPMGSIRRILLNPRYRERERGKHIVELVELPVRRLRLAGIFASLLLGIALPGGLLGPVLFGGDSLRAISTGALVTAVVSGVFGAWLLVVSCLASIKDLEKVLEPLQADMAVVLFLPCMFIVGTRSVWRRIVGSAKRN